MKSLSTTLLLSLLFLIKTQGFAAPLCADLFQAKAIKPTATKTQSADQKLLEFFKTKTELSYEESQKLKTFIHQSILSIASDPQLKVQTPQLLAEVEMLIAQRPQKRNSYDALKQELTTVKKLLQLVNADVNEWFKYLSKDDANFGDYNTYATAGFLLERLPAADKAVLLEKLGQAYAKTKNRNVVQPIHVLLNPKKMYADFKRQGRSDREFYNHYLEIMKKYTFNSNDLVSGYSGDLVIQSALTMQKYLQSKPKLQALNFFGSIPNGFGREKSDYDVFNHPIESRYPKLQALAKENEGNWRAEDPFEKLRYQVDDPVLEKMLQDNISGTQWQWHLENEGEHAHEHFGAQSHIFSFHITKEKVVLRFYANYIRVNTQGKPLEPWEYISLDVTD